MPIKYLNRNNVGASAPVGNSVQFNGSNFLNCGSNALFSFGTGNFTVEGWIYLTQLNRFNALFSNGGAVAGAIALYTFTNNKLSFAEYFGTDVNGTTTLSINTWYHVAVTRSGSTVRLFLNGNIENSNPSDSFNNTTNNLIIGEAWGTNMNGYISNFRVVKGTALYTSNFTPSTTPLTAIANTSLLTCQSATIVDNSTNNFTITNNGSATVSSTVPFTAIPATGGIAYKNRNNNRILTPTGNSVLFNGTNQYLSIPSNAAFNLGTGSFTVECWFYATANVSSQQCLITNYGGSSAGWAIQITSGVIGANLSGDGFDISGGSPAINTWYHAALSGAQGSIKLFLNGVQVGSTYTGAVSMNTSAAVTIGNIVNTAHMAGYISNVRLVKGTALYTSNFTPPTSPLTAIANTSLLTCNAATIVDGSSNNFTITNNNSATVSSTTPFTVATATSTMKLKKVFADPIVVYLTQKAIFGYGFNGSNLSMTNLVSNTGVVATDTTGVGTARHSLAAAGYGTDKVIFGYGIITGGGTPNQSITNLVSNTGVVATDTTGVGTARYALAASGYGTNKAIFGYGTTGTNTSITNLVSNTGVVATDTAGVGTARFYPAAAGYGTDKAIFGYGLISSNPGVSMTNLVSNTGVVSTDTTGVGSARFRLGASGYGTDKAIFGYGANGSTVSMTNLVSNTGVVASDTTGVGTARESAAGGYGSDKAIFGYGYASGFVSMTNLVSNTGVVATDTTGVGTARSANAAAGFSLT